jgi:hypothetical protein
MLTHKKSFVIILSSYIGLFTGFYIWSSLLLNKGLTEDIRYVVTAFFVISLISFLPSKVRIKPVIPLIFFISYCCLIMIFHNELPHVALYVLWVIYALIVLPNLMSINITIFKTYVTYLFYALIVLILMLFLFATYFDLELFWGAEFRRRLTFGLSNPGIFSHLVFTTLWLCILLCMINDRKIYLVFLPFLVYLLFLANIRTDELGTLIGLFVLLALYSRYSLVYLLIASLLLLALMLIIVSSYSMNDMDILLSGRINFWKGLHEASGFSHNLKVFFFGTGIYSGHYDNQWLKTIYMFGLTGLIIYLYAFLYLFISFYNLAKNTVDPTIRIISIWATATWSMFAFMGMTAYIFPSLGNAFNLILIPILIAVSCFSITSKFIHSNS